MRIIISVSKVSKQNYYVITFLALILSLLSVTSASTALASGEEVVEKWPSDGVSIVVQPREFKLVLSQPSEASSYKVFLEKIEENSTESELGRLTRGMADTIYFVAPLLDSGEYAVRWVYPDGEAATTFAIDEPVVAPGGGNHRHEFTLDLKNSIDHAYTVVLFILVFILLSRLRLKPLYTIPVVLVGLGLVFFSVGESIYDMYGTHGEIGTDFWKDLAGNSIWAYSIMGSLLLTYPFVYYGTARVFHMLWAIALAFTYSGQGVGHPSVPYFEIFATEGLIIVLTAALLERARLNIFSKEAKNLVYKIRNIKIPGGPFLMLTLVVVSYLNFTAYAGSGTPSGLFRDALITKIVALTIFGSILFAAPLIKKRSNLVNILLFAIAAVAGGFICMSPPIAAGI